MPAKKTTRKRKSKTTAGYKARSLRKKTTTKKKTAQKRLSKKKAPGKKTTLKTKASSGAKKKAKKAASAAKRQAAPISEATLGTFPQETHSGEQSGDLQGLSRYEGPDSESVDELMEEGNAFEADVVSGVEEADNADEKEVHTHEVPEDDVPGEYLDKDQ
jgi:hypothetical protein